MDSGILVAADDGDGWETTRVDEACGDDADGCGADAAPAWAVDSDGRSHVAWVRNVVAGNGSRPGLWHAIQHANGTWTSGRVLALSEGLSAPDIAIGPDDAVHVAFVRTDAGNAGSTTPRTRPARGW